MDNIFNTFKHLFSRSQAWRLVASPVKEYIKGYSYFPATIRDFIDNVWNDIFPSKTREIEKWEQQFNLTQAGTAQERIDNLSGRWSAQGGQGFDYLQDLIHNSGYPQVFLHQWWLPSDAYRVYCLAPDSDCGSGDAECGVFIPDGAIGTIDPNDYLGSFYTVYCLSPNSDCGSSFADCGDASFDTGQMLVNKGPEVASFDYSTYCLSPDSDCGSTDSECGVVAGLTYVPIEYQIPQDPTQWRYIIYAGAETFGEIAEVPAELQDELERLLLGKLPYQQWIGSMINYV